MNPKHHAEFDPYSDKSLRSVEMIESLPMSSAFEHVMYDNLLDRTTQFKYAHSEDTADDKDPLTIDPDLMVDQFPEQLRSIFPAASYTIEQLRVQHIEMGNAAAADEQNNTTLEMSFRANQTIHSLSVKEGVAEYLTTNEALEDVTYLFTPEVATALLAAFVYAKQYDPLKRLPIELSPSTIHTERNAQTDLLECLIMTLGDHTGHSNRRTRAIFETPSGSAVIATLDEHEFPDKSAAHNTLLLSEFNDINNIPTSVETTLFQNVVTIEVGMGLIQPGQLASRYAEQRSTTLSAIALTASEYIDPKSNYERWARTCTTFRKAIKKPMKAYAYLDETNLD